MARGMFEVACPCCEAILTIDPETGAVIAHTVKEKPRPIEDFAAEVEKLKGAGARREEIFQKNVAAEKSHAKVLEKKFDELFKRAKESDIVMFVWLFRWATSTHSMTVWNALRTLEVSAYRLVIPRFPKPKSVKSSDMKSRNDLALPIIW